MKIPVVVIDDERDEIVIDEIAVRAYHERIGVAGGVADFLRVLADAFERERPEPGQNRGF
jgi:hypothetical protein